MQGLGDAGQFATEFLRHYISARQRRPLLPRQSERTYLQDKFQVTPTFRSLPACAMTGMAASPKNTGNIFNFDPSSTATTPANDTIDQYRLHHCRQQQERHQGRKRHDADRPPVGHRSPSRRGMAACGVPQQSRGSRRRRHVLRPRRTIHLPFARLRHRQVTGGPSASTSSCRL